MVQSSIALSKALFRLLMIVFLWIPIIGNSQGTVIINGIRGSAYYFQDCEINLEIGSGANASNFLTSLLRSERKLENSFSVVPLNPRLSENIGLNELVNLIEQYHSKSEATARSKQVLKFRSYQDTLMTLYSILEFGMDINYEINPFSQIIRGAKLFGYLHKGDTIIKPFYDEADWFHNGLAKVKKGTKYGFIDEIGNVILDRKFDWVSQNWDGKFLLGNNQKAIWANACGEEILQFISLGSVSIAEGVIRHVISDCMTSYYFPLDTSYVVKTFNSGTEFVNGIALAERNDSLFRVSSNGSVLLLKKPKTVGYIGYVLRSNLIVAEERDGGYGILLDSNLNLLADGIQFSSFEYDPSGIHFLREREGEWIIVSFTGDVISNVQYHKYKPIGLGYFMVQRQGKWGMVNRLGNEFIPAKFDTIQWLGDYLYATRIGEEWGIADISGDIVSEPVFSSLNKSGDSAFVGENVNLFVTFDIAGRPISQLDYNPPKVLSLEVPHLIVPPIWTWFWKQDSSYRYLNRSSLFLGCSDFDGDGIDNRLDLCRFLPGPADAQGCPDSDKDGVSDMNDKCNGVLGSKTAFGCPDADLDGVADSQDSCKTIKGALDYCGCPGQMTIFMPKDESYIPIEARDSLNAIARCLEFNSDLRIKIVGFCDRELKKRFLEQNKSLVESRVILVRDYLGNKPCGYDKLSLNYDVTKGFEEESKSDQIKFKGCEVTIYSGGQK